MIKKLILLSFFSLALSGFVGVSKLRAELSIKAKSTTAVTANESLNISSKTYSTYSAVTLSTFAVASAFRAPTNDVSQSYAYPVPFDPASGDTRIAFDRLPDFGNIRIYSSVGELIKKIDFNSPVDGKTDWDITDSEGQKLGSDVYLYVIQSGKSKKTGKLVIHK